MMASEPAPKQPYVKWFPSDWRGDHKLQRCAPMTRYVWFEMCMTMHDCEPYGHFAENGERFPVKEFADMLRMDVKDVRNAMRELRDKGVASVSEDGIFYSRRMVRTKTKSDLGKETGKTGGNPALVLKKERTRKQRVPAEGVNPHIESQSPESIFQSPSSPKAPSGAVGGSGEDGGTPAAQALVNSSKPPPADDWPDGYAWQILIKTINHRNLDVNKAASLGTRGTMLHSWQRAGCSWVHDVLPVVRTVVDHSKEPILSWEFFENRIYKARDLRLKEGRPAPVAKPAADPAVTREKLISGCFMDWKGPGFSWPGSFKPTFSELESALRKHGDATDKGMFTRHRAALEALLGSGESAVAS